MGAEADKVKGWGVRYGYLGCDWHWRWLRLLNLGVSSWQQKLFSAVYFPFLPVS